jgi:SM-20-related protein
MCRIFHFSHLVQTAIKRGLKPLTKFFCFADTVLIIEPASIHTETTRNACEQIVVDLLDKGWSVIPGFIQSDLLHSLRLAASSYWNDQQFYRAGIGKGNDHTVHDTVRTDYVMWIDPAAASAPIRQYLDIIEQLRLELNRKLLLGLFEFEGHIAFYPRGTYYRKHLDQFRNDDMRIITSILYLNENWRAEDGGQLRIYTGDNSCLDILPLAGQLVTFLSSDFFHEVLPTKRERLSISGWYKKRDFTRLLHQAVSAV